MNLGSIFDAVAKMMGKDHTGGFFTPIEINTCAAYINAQMYSKKRKAYEDGRRSDDTRVVVKTLGDSLYAPVMINSNGYGDLPTDYKGMSTVRWCQVTAQDDIDCDDPTTWVNKDWKMVEVVTDDQLSDRLSNRLKGPTLKNPICTIQNNLLKVYPEAIPYIQLTYFREPAEVFYDFNIGSDDFPTYLPPDSVHDGTNLTAGTASNSVEFEWPGCEDEIIALALQYYGVDANSQMPVSVGTQKAVEND